MFNQKAKAQPSAAAAPANQEPNKAEAAEKQPDSGVGVVKFKNNTHTSVFLASIGLLLPAGETVEAKISDDELDAAKTEIHRSCVMNGFSSSAYEIL